MTVATDYTMDMSEELALVIAEPGRDLLEVRATLDDLDTVFMHIGTIVREWTGLVPPEVLAAEENARSLRRQFRGLWTLPPPEATVEESAGGAVLGMIAGLVKLGPKTVTWPNDLKARWHRSKADAEKACQAYERLYKRRTAVKESRGKKSASREPKE